MFNSVRIRLTLWYTAVLACVLAALALATYLILRNNLRHRTDSALTELADSFLTTVHAELRDGGESNNIGEATQAAISEHRFRDTVFLVLDQKRRVVAASEGFTVLVGSADQSGDAAARSWAVCMAVPDGASTFWSWCSSMISAESK